MRERERRRRLTPPKTNGKTPRACASTSLASTGPS
jgi:hypothetical protein